MMKPRLIIFSILLLLFCIHVTYAAAPNVTSYTPDTPTSSYVDDNQTFTVNLNQTVNVTWYIDCIEYYNETNVTTSSYSNSTAVAGNHNVTAIAENANGTVQQVWNWIVKVHENVPLSIFIMWSIIALAAAFIGIIKTGLLGITSSLFSVIVFYMNSKQIISGNVVEYFSGVSSTDTIIIGTRSVESLPLSYIYLFMALIMLIVFILQVKNEIQYQLEPMVGDIDLE